MTWEDAQERYCARLAERSADTARQWWYVIKRFVEAADVDMAGLTLAHVEAYRASVAARLSLPTAHLYLTAIRLFLCYCAEHGWILLRTQDIQAALKTKPVAVEHPFEILSADEITRLLATADDRQRAALACGLFAGLRVNEIASLRVGHIVQDAQRGTFLFVQRGKGQKDRRVPLAPDVYALLVAYAGERAPMEYLFDIRRARLRDVIERAVRQAGITRRITPHSLRHTYAYRLYAAGVPLLAISKLLGHASIATTQRYIDHMTESEVAQYAPSMI